MKLIILLLLTLFIVIVSGVNFSDADFSVRKEIGGNSFSSSVLDFSSQDSASGEKVATLFNIAKLIPGGTASKILRLIPEEGGQKRALTANLNQASQNEFCHGLDLLVLRDWNRIYDGELINFSLKIGEFSGKEDLVFILTRAPRDFPSGQCVFDLVFMEGSEKAGFFANRVLTNLILTQN